MLGGPDLYLGLFWGSDPGFGPIVGDPAWIWAYFGVLSLDLGLFWRIWPGFVPILGVLPRFGPILGNPAWF